MILNNYATTDIGAAVSRLLVAISMIGGFPLIFMALKSAAADLFGPKPGSSAMENSDQKQQKLSKILFSSVLAISMFVKDAGFVVGLNGAIMGSAIIYAFPSLMFLRLAKSGRIAARKGERLLCRSLVVFGVLSALMGGGTTILNSYFPHLLK